MFSCGVNWEQDHVSLDCLECGGYSLERPCPICIGHCRNVWKRDLEKVSRNKQNKKVVYTIFIIFITFFFFSFIFIVS